MNMYGYRCVIKHIYIYMTTPLMTTNRYRLQREMVQYERKLQAKPDEAPFRYQIRPKLHAIAEASRTSARRIAVTEHIFSVYPATLTTKRHVAEQRESFPTKSETLRQRKRRNRAPDTAPFRAEHSDSNRHQTASVFADNNTHKHAENACMRYTVHERLSNDRNI